MGELFKKAHWGVTGRYNDFLKDIEREKTSAKNVADINVGQLSSLIAERMSSQMEMLENPRADRGARRIAWLIEHCLLEVGRTDTDALYIDYQDRRLWEKTKKEFSWSAGFGATMLAVIAPDEAYRKYHYRIGDEKKSAVAVSAPAEG